MLQEFSSTPTLREASPCVLETERLSLRRPTLADVKAIARLANDRRIVEHTRRLPYPYLQDDAIAFVRYTAAEPRDIWFLIEHNFAPVGVVGLNMLEPEAPEIGYWLGVEHWGQGFATESRARGDRLLLRGVRQRAPACRRAASPTPPRATFGKMRLPVERRRTAPLRGTRLLLAGRPFSAVEECVVVAEALGEFGAEGGVGSPCSLAPLLRGEGWGEGLFPRVAIHR